jgi:hypothetical protein
VTGTKKAEDDNGEPGTVGGAGTVVAQGEGGQLLKKNELVGCARIHD